MSTPTAQIKVSLDKAQAEADATSLRDSLLGALTPVVDVADLAGKAWTLFAEGMHASVGAAIEAEVAESRLTAALHQRGIASGVVLDRMRAYNTALSMGTGIADESLLSVQSLLVAHGANTNALEAATRATLGLAEVSGKGLDSAAQTVARVLDGNTKILERYGIHAHSAAEALDLLAAKQSIVSDLGQTTQGRIDRLSNAIGELAEKIGGIVLDKDKNGEGWLDTLADKARLAVVGVGELIDHGNGWALAAGSFSLATNIATGNFIAGSASISTYASELVGMGEDAENAAKSLAKLTEEQSRQRIADEVRDKASAERFNSQLRNRVGAMAAGGTGVWFDADAGEGSVIRKRTSEEKAEDRAAEAEARRAATERQRMGSRLDAFGSGLVDITADIAAGATLTSDLVAQDEERMQRREDIQREYTDRREQIEIDHQARMQTIAVSAAEEQKRIDDEAASNKEKFIESVATGFLSLGASLAAGLGAAAANSEDASLVLKKFAGQTIVMLGTTVFELGAAAVAAGTLGSIVPIFAGPTAGPLGVAAGVAAMAAGSLMIAGGTALGASGGTRSGASAGAGAGAAARARGPGELRTEADSGFRSGNRGGEPIVNNFNVNFMGGIFGGDTRRVARDLQDLLRDGQSLVPRRAGGGF